MIVSGRKIQDRIDVREETRPWCSALLRAFVLFVIIDVLPRACIGELQDEFGLRSLLGTVVILICATVGIRLAPRVGIEACPVIDFGISGRGQGIAILSGIVAGIAFGTGEVTLVRVISWNNGWRISQWNVPYTIAVMFFNFASIEEIAFRLFLFTALYWAGVASLRPSRPRLRLWLFWAANFAQAIMFGWVHVAEGGALSTSSYLATRMLAAPALWGGLIEGFLYWRFGIESAIIEHTIYDLLAPSQITIAPRRFIA